MRLKCVRVLIVLLLVFGYINFCGFLTYKKVEKKVSFSSDSKAKVSNNLVFTETKHIESTTVLASISIPKIGLKQKLYNINSKENNVDKNIQVLKESNMPGEVNGNFILAAHSGFSPIAYFHNLYKLEVGDKVFIDYGGKRYEYIVFDKYEVLKTGKVEIKRDKSKTAITMITCKGEDKQIVVIGYLKG